MLSLFPNLFFLTPIAVALIRITAGLVFAYLAWNHGTDGSSVSPSLKVLAAIESACALLLVAGLYTQGAALLGVGLFALYVAMPKLRIFPTSTNILLLVMSISLLIMGAGAWGFDLPL